MASYRIYSFFLALAAAFQPLGGSAVTGGDTAAAFECRGNPLTPAAGAALLAEVQTTYGRTKTLRARFVQDSYLAALDASERSGGQVWFEKPGKMRWEYESPETQLFVVRDETVWLYQPASNQVLIDRFRDVLISDLPVSFLMGLGSLSTDFTLRKACPTPAGGAVLELAPRAGGAQASSDALAGFVLLVDAGRMPSGAKVVDVGGNITAIRLLEVTPNAAIDSARFNPDFPKGTDINDQRPQPGA
jgi:outer membrane lipoprotein carrier protein